jgi:hypothetical protein
MMKQARQVIQQIKNANGPAQHVTFAIWGMIMAGMYAGMGVPDWLVVTWFMTSLAMLPAVLFLSKRVLEYVILLDVFLTAVVLTLYVTYTPVVHPMYHSPHEWDVSSHIFGPIFMVIHGLYLANLVQRQRLERKRLSGLDNAD